MNQDPIVARGRAWKPDPTVDNEKQAVGHGSPTLRWIMRNKRSGMEARPYDG